MARLMMLEELQHRLSVQVVPIFSFSETTSVIAGTAVLIAPGIAFTALHVMDELIEKLGISIMSDAKLDIYLFQLSSGSVWYVSNISHWIGTDIAVLSLCPRNEEAENKQINRIQMTVDSPLEDEIVTAIGYPKSTLEIPRNDEESLHINLEIHPTVEEGKVSEIYASYRDTANIRFPSFSIEADFYGGMSGGPVFNEKGQICGLVCSGGEGELSGYSVATSIWPACIIPAHIPDSVEAHKGVTLGTSHRVLELAQVGYIDLVGHDRIEFFTHENGSLGIRRITKNAFMKPHN